MIQPPPPSDGKGHSYDLSSLAMDNNNWVVESTTPGSSATQQRFYINMCRSLVLQRGEFDLGPVFGRVPSYLFSIPVPYMIGFMITALPVYSISR